MSRPIVSWSYSALSDFKNCPFKYWAVKIDKQVSDQNAFNQRGDDYHKEFEAYVHSGRALGPALQRFQPVLEKLRRAAGVNYVEHKMALTQEYAVCGFKDWDHAWVRAISDYLNLNGENGVCIDYKFGKYRNDPEQNSLVAAVAFQTYPQLQRIKTAYYYAMHDKMTPVETYTRADIPRIWNEFLPDVNRLVQSKVEDKWPKTPNPLCKYCPVASCQHNTNPDLKK